MLLSQKLLLPFNLLSSSICRRITSSMQKVFRQRKRFFRWHHSLLRSLVLQHTIETLLFLTLRRRSRIESISLMLWKKSTRRVLRKVRSLPTKKPCHCSPSHTPPMMPSFDNDQASFFHEQKSIEFCTLSSKEGGCGKKVYKVHHSFCLGDMSIYILYQVDDMQCKHGVKFPTDRSINMSHYSRPC